MLAQAFRATQKHDRAVEEWDVAAQIEPKVSSHQLEAIRSLAAAGKNDVARLRLEAFLKKNPNNADAKKLGEEMKK